MSSTIDTNDGSPPVNFKINGNNAQVDTNDGSPPVNIKVNDNNAHAVTGIVVTLLVLAAIGAISCFCARKMRKRIITELRTAVAEPHPNLVQVAAVDAPTMERFLEASKKPVRFTAQQLCSFTNNYSTLLGSGGFGVVYGGKFPNGSKIAVKVLNRSSEKHAEEQFMAEVGTLGRTYHINLVRLYGFCYDQYMSALVYEFMENGSLDRFLFNETSTIGWEKLHEIAIATAKGIAYLHEDCPHRIIHYDIKPANVLLDENFLAKVADFGLAKLCNRDNTHDSVTGYKGTPGYSAPEFMLKNHPITHKCDVYSFGMVLFEIVGGRKNAIMKSTDSIDWFPKRVWEEYEKGELPALTMACGTDEKLRKKAETMSLVALWCVQDSPEARPPMSAVVKMLEGEVEIVPPPKPFHFLYSIGMDAFSSSGNSSDSGSQATREDNSQWYRETTEIMARYEIQVASS